MKQDWPTSTDPQDPLALDLRSLAYLALKGGASDSLQREQILLARKHCLQSGLMLLQVDLEGVAVCFAWHGGMRLPGVRLASIDKVGGPYTEVMTNAVIGLLRRVHLHIEANRHLTCWFLTSKRLSFEM